MLLVTQKGLVAHTPTVLYTGKVLNGIVELAPTGKPVVMIFIAGLTTTLRVDNIKRLFTRKNGERPKRCLTKNSPKLKLLDWVKKTKLRLKMAA